MQLVSNLIEILAREYEGLRTIWDGNTVASGFDNAIALLLREAKRSRAGVEEECDLLAKLFIMGTEVLREEMYSLRTSVSTRLATFVDKPREHEVTLLATDTAVSF